MITADSSLTGFFLATVFLTFIIPLVPTAVVATGEAGVNTAQFLRLPVGARGPALGDALTSVSMGAESIHYNPAGLIHNRSGNISMTYDELAAGITQGDMHYIRNYGGSGNAIGLGTKYVNYGDIQESNIRTRGSVVSSIDEGTFGAMDSTIALSYGHRFVDDWSVGLTGKYIYRTIAGVSASAYAVDGGVQAWDEQNGLTYGLALKNIGTDMTFDEKAERLPRVLRGGIGYAPFSSLVFLLDVEKEQDVPADFLTGVEWHINPSVATRLGYNDRSDVGSNLTGGFGLSLPYLTLNYSYQSFEEFGQRHRFNLVFYLE